MIVVSDRPRLANRSWMEEFDDLAAQGLYGDSTAVTGKPLGSRAVFAAEKAWIFEASNLEMSPIAPMPCVSCAVGGWSSDASIQLSTGTRKQSRRTE